jgi:hypothetical protein
MLMQSFIIKATYGNVCELVFVSEDTVSYTGSVLKRLNTFK